MLTTFDLDEYVCSMEQEPKSSRLHGRGGVCLNEHGKGQVVVCNYNIDKPTDKYRYWSTHPETTI